MNPNQTKTTLSLPLMLAGVAIVGGGMFFVGRSLAPTPAVQTVEPEEHSEEEHGHEEGGHEEGGHEEHGAGETVVFTPAALKSAGITMAPVGLELKNGGVPFNGQIEVSPDRLSRIASVVPGRVTRLYVSIGQHVTKGQLLATVESRAVGEAQSAFAQASARLKNARASYDITLRQAKAGAFSQAPLEAARRARADAAAEARTQETALRQTRMALENTVRLVRAGSFSRPNLEAARGQAASAQESLKSAQAAADNAEAAIQSAQAELERRRQVAANGGYASRQVEEARRSLVSAQSTRATAQSEVATTRANLSRAKSLAAEGLISQRDLETAQTAFESATAHLISAQEDVRTVEQELERQQKLAASNVAGTAELQDAQARLATARADAKTREAEVQRATTALQLANGALKREETVFQQNIANRREVSEARAKVESARNTLGKTREILAVSDAALQRESRIASQNLNNIAQVTAARSAVVAAQSDKDAAANALSLLKSAPGGSAMVPIRSPLTGTIQTRDVAQGDVIEADRLIITVADLSRVHVDMFLPERDIARVRVGLPVGIAVDAIPGKTFGGQVELIHPDLDPKTRTVEAHAEITNPGQLRPGMFARGRIRTDNFETAILVPADAVQNLEDKRVVFVAGEKDGEFAPREVKTGATQNGKTQILQGLTSGEKVVVKGAFMVKAQSMKAELGHEH